MHVVDLLVRQTAVVLEDIVVDAAYGARELGGHREELREFVIGDLVELCTMGLRDYHLGGFNGGECVHGGGAGLTACPRESGWMSRNARTLVDSRSCAVEDQLLDDGTESLRR